MNLKRTTAQLVSFLLIASTGVGLANDRPGIWITPFGGYRLNGSIPLDDPNFSKMDLVNNPVYGLAAGLEVSEEGIVELMWTHHDTEAHAVPASGGPPAESFNLKVDQFHLNGLYFPPGFEEGPRPYAIAGVGVTHYAPVGDANAMDKFSWALGGGAHFKFTPRLGLRLEAKWDPAFVTSSGGVFCNSATGRCFVAASGELINQFDFTAGLTIRL